MQIEIQIPKAVLFDVKYTVEQATNAKKRSCTWILYAKRGVSCTVFTDCRYVGERISSRSKR